MSTQAIVVIVYFIIVTLVGVFSARKARSSDDFLVAGRKMGIVMCAAAIAGEWIGGTSTVGVAEGGFRYGISASWYSIANAAGTVVLALTLARLYRRAESFTVTGFMEAYFDKATKVLASLVLTFVMIVVASVQMVAGGALLNAMTGLPMAVSMVGTGLVFLAYTLAGGLWAVGYTNLIHVVVIYLSLILGLVVTWRRAGGLSATVSNLPARPYFSMMGAGTSTVVAWIMASVFAALVAQAAVQPVMGAKDERTARDATFLAVLLVVPSGIICALLGMFAKVRLPGVAPKSALPSLMMGLPPWMGGSVLAGILAAILSTVAPCILAAGTLLSKEIYQGWLRPRASGQEVYKVSRLMTLISGILAIIWAMYCPVILDQVYFAYTLRATIAILLLFGVYFRGTKRSSGKWALALGAIIALVWEMIKAARGAYLWGIHPMYAAGTVTAGTILVSSSWKPCSVRGALPTNEQQ